MASKKQQTHQRILASMHQTFRQNGYDGAGVNSLANGAGVTSGAFYAHFGSKSNAFKEVVTEGVNQLDAVLTQFQETHGKDWLEQFVLFYMGEKRCSDLSESCALQSLTPEVTRSDDNTRAIFQEELLKVVATFNRGIENYGEETKHNAWATLSMIIGGVTLARAVKDPDIAEKIAEAIQGSITDKG
ncbi:TetR/AcrR family transcriptional regulator [Pseudoalteromonas luteoviolacea]|uniref:TetR/AcrR family transcriptional regulator n=1 Tax=Pseudoalteromonas luteoviolacea TaxID=43657 RepID=UPI00114E84A6|nr:TetR/AcrR family transcriptional regulator [Pseudoalteromonas luteoviolacea]TQF70072.1 TetR/AcrR family transcriptional regulator [Pseudoalteromonas luteoviolacea]